MIALEFAENIAPEQKELINQLLEEHRDLKDLGKIIKGWVKGEDYSVRLGDSQMEGLNYENFYVSFDYSGEGGSESVASYEIPKSEIAKVFPAVKPIKDFFIGYDAEDYCSIMDDEGLDRYEEKFLLEYSDDLCANVTPFESAVEYMMSYACSEGAEVSIRLADKQVLFLEQLPEEKILIDNILYTVRASHENPKAESLKGIRPMIGTYFYVSSAEPDLNNWTSEQITN